MVESISLEKFYDHFDKQVNLTASFTDKEEVSKIIKMCRLKPYDLILGNYSEKIMLHEHWIDEFRNSFFIRKDKKINIKLNDLSIDFSKIVSTDLYQNLSIDKVAKISKLLFFFQGKDEDTNAPHIILSFLGIDNFLRTFVLIYNQWHYYPSLFLGINVLFEIAKNLDIQQYKKIKLTKKVIYPCTSQQGWITYWPPSKDFVSILKEDYDFLPILLHLNKK